MMPSTPAEFVLFPKLPSELRQMIWHEALPTLDLQRFTAEIAPHPSSPSSNTKPEGLVLCLTPNDDFARLASGYLGLLGASRESRRAAIAKISCFLPINYVARGGDGSFVVRSARVPFNPDGHLCISGLGPALEAAAEGYGARGMELQASYWSQDLVEGIRCAAFPEVRNLTISLDPPRDPESRHAFMLGWDHCAFDTMAKRMDGLETVALVDEGVLDERHRIPERDLAWLHRPAEVVRPGQDNDGWDYELDEPSAVRIPWLKLYSDFKFSLGTFNALKEFRAGNR